MLTAIKVESAFAEPMSFVPERWYSRPELVKDKQTFAPFGLGMHFQVPPTF